MLKRIGHKGADLITPGNTLASFDAALEAGVDMVEFDVLPEHSRRLPARLVLAHDYRVVVARGGRSRSRRGSPTSPRTRGPASSRTST